MNHLNDHWAYRTDDCIWLPHIHQSIQDQCDLSCSTYFEKCENDNEVACRPIVLIENRQFARKRTTIPFFLALMWYHKLEQKLVKQ